MHSVIPFAEIQAGDAIGGKAGNLALLFQSQFPVPRGFIITAEALAHGLQGNMRLRQEIEAAYNQFVNPPVIVRSSCSAEDLVSASFAGQYESIPNVTLDNLLESVKRCWQSVDRDFAQTYRAQRFASGDRAPVMSVIVQEFVEADAAGVVFSKNPITGNGNEIVINANYGLGESVVSGLATPDFYILSKQGTAIPRMELGEKVSKSVLDRHGTRLVETTAEERSRFCLQEEQLHELKNMTLAIETLMGHAVDLEFAYRQGKLYILQARPITT